LPIFFQFFALYSRRRQLDKIFVAVGWQSQWLIGLEERRSSSSDDLFILSVMILQREDDMVGHVVVG